MNATDSLPDEDQDEILRDRIVWTRQKQQKIGELSVDDQVGMLTALQDLCVVRQRRSERFAQAVQDGSLCAECPCRIVAELAGGVCHAGNT